MDNQKPNPQQLTGKRKTLGMTKCTISNNTTSTPTSSTSGLEEAILSAAGKQSFGCPPKEEEEGDGHSYEIEECTEEDIRNSIRPNRPLSYRFSDELNPKQQKASKTTGGVKMIQGVLKVTVKRRAPGTTESECESSRNPPQVEMKKSKTDDMSDVVDKLEPNKTIQSAHTSNQTATTGLIDQLEKVEISSSSKPSTPRAILHVDPRFFPDGLQANQIVEIFGPSNVGKTFLIIYFTYKILVKYPSKKVIWLDAAHHLYFGHLINLLYYGTIQPPTMKRGISEKEIMAQNPGLEQYTKRVIRFETTNFMQFMVAVAPDSAWAPGVGPLSKYLHDNVEDVAVVFMDTFDSYSFSHSSCRDQIFDVLRNLRKTCGSIPIVGSTIERKTGCVLKSTTPTVEASTTKDANVVKEYYANVIVNPRYITHTLEISWASGLDKQKQEEKFKTVKFHHLANASYKNCRKASPPHRVQFAINNDVLYVLD